MQTNDNFEIANRWLGWGDPYGALWFVGVEEGAELTSDILRDRHGKTFNQSPIDPANLSWPVANTTAKVAARVAGIRDHIKYRDSLLWREGSRVFNANLYPLGRYKQSNWPDTYPALFGLSHNDYRVGVKLTQVQRIAEFKRFQREMKPQAIVCFGKSLWPEFQELFVSDSRDCVQVDRLTLRLFPNDRVILTGHFSYGSWMSNEAVRYVADTLTQWGVSVRSDEGGA